MSKNPLSAALLASAALLMFGACLPSFPTNSLDSGILLLSGDSVTASEPPTASSVNGLYSGFAGWNDYIQNDGTTILNATGTACTGGSTGGYSSCIHAGLMKTISISNRTSCTGLSATDSQAALLWECDNSTGSVRVIATGFIPGKGLRDLIDFSNGSWRSMSVTVTDSGGSTTTEASQWWSNTIHLNHQPGTAIALSNAGEVYAYSVKPMGDVAITADKISVVSNQTFFWEGAALASNLVNASSSNYLWIEIGQATGVNKTIGIALSSVKYSVIHLSRIQNTNNQGIQLSTSHNNLLRYISSSSNQAQAAIELNTSNYNTLSNIFLSNSPAAGLLLQTSNNNTISNVLGANNWTQAIRLASSTNNAILNVTAANNNGNGISIENTSLQNSLISLAMANNPVSLRTDSTSHQNSIVHTAEAHSSTGYDFNSNYNYFTGVFRVGSSCAGTGTAGISGSCTPNQASVFTPQGGAGFGGSFLGRITSEDLVNGSDMANGAQIVGSIADWLHFGNLYRLWGRAGGGAFPLGAQRGDCTAGNCHIFDWRLSSSDSMLLNNLAVPDGNVALAHIWSATTQAECNTINRAVWTTNVCSFPGFANQSACETPGGNWTGPKCVSLFLGNSYEFIGDGYGNENGICESFELCVYSPNIGVYQGQGSFTSVGAITNGAIKGVFLIKHSTNGSSL